MTDRLTCGDFLVDRVVKSVMTMNELWINQSPNTNFEMGKTLLLQRALDKGFVTCVGPNRYEVNHNYELMWCNYNRPADGKRFMTTEEIEQQVDQLAEMDLEDDKND